MNRRVLISAAALTLAIVGTARAHTMFLKLESFFLEPNSGAIVQLINGDFDLSYNTITRDRMLDVSLVGPEGRWHPPESAWRDSAIYELTEDAEGEKDSIDTSVLEFETGASGTYVLGVSTAARVFDLSGEDFDGYLVHDGIEDVIAVRAAQGRTGEAATERYSKHVKALLQVGSTRSDGFAHELGYPIEFVPLDNPYELRVGDDLRVRLLRERSPLANHLVYASSERHHSHDDEGGH
ncbi:MAG: DUF4198 domain-containing protein, partial [Gemmatimonadetes bacterium]|nr:DUF4198 domain-containing protein [Gemmatimonadota bacterium]